MAIIESLASAVMGGIVTLGGREILSAYRRPKISLDLYELDGIRPFVVDRQLNKSVIDTQHGRLINIEMAKDIHIIVGNTGYRPAKGCEATMNIKEDGTEVPNPIRLGWRKRPPILYQNLDFGEQMRQRTAPMDINRESKALLDILRLKYEKRKYKEEKEFKKECKDLTTLSAFRNHDFQKNIQYEIEITVTSANTNPESIELRLKWDGGYKNEDLQSAISVV